MDTPTMESLEALLAQLQAQSPVQGHVPEGCFTTLQLTKVSSMGIKSAQALVRDAVRDGKAEFAGKFPVLNICGTMQCVPHYRLIRVAKAAKKAARRA